MPILSVKSFILTGSCLILAGASLAAAALEDTDRPEQKAEIANDPAFRNAPLQLVSVSRPGRRRALFNGRDLSEWNSWLGYADPNQTYTAVGEPSIGLNRDKLGVFSVVREDNRPAIRISGEKWGALISKRRFANYHLHLEFKWGPRTWLPIPRNSGVLYHSHGRYGAFAGTWMTSMEFEISPPSTGMLMGVGDSHRKDISHVELKTAARTETSRDPALPFPFVRFMPGGRPTAVAYPEYRIEPSANLERPVGEWNTIDLYVFGDSAIHVVNGVPVMVARNITTTDGHPGKPTPLTGGFIQIQSEGAEAFFRDISLEPIYEMPEVGPAH